MPHRKNSCDCRSRFDVELVRQDDYSAFKRVLDIGRHPSFIGRQTFKANAINGGALLYKYKEESAAVSLINPRYGILLALNVVPEHRSHGLGGAIVKYLIPNFARVIEDKIPFFEAQGYQSIGEPKQGIKLKTQIMVRAQLLSLTGRLSSVWGCVHG